MALKLSTIFTSRHLGATYQRFTVWPLKRSRALAIFSNEIMGGQGYLSHYSWRIAVHILMVQVYRARLDGTSHYTNQCHWSSQCFIFINQSHIVENWPQNPQASSLLHVGLPRHGRKGSNRLPTHSTPILGRRSSSLFPLGALLWKPYRGRGGGKHAVFELLLGNY